MENKAGDFNVSTALHGLLSSDSAVAAAARQWCEERRADPLEWLKELLTYLSINRDLKSKIQRVAAEEITSTVQLGELLAEEAPEVYQQALGVLKGDSYVDTSGLLAEATLSMAYKYQLGVEAVHCALRIGRQALRRVQDNAANSNKARCGCLGLIRGLLRAAANESEFRVGEAYGVLEVDPPQLRDRWLDALRRCVDGGESSLASQLVVGMYKELDDRTLRQINTNQDHVALVQRVLTTYIDFEISVWQSIYERAKTNPSPDPLGDYGRYEATTALCRHLQAKHFGDQEDEDDGDDDGEGEGEGGGEEALDRTAELYRDLGDTDLAIVEGMDALLDCRPRDVLLEELLETGPPALAATLFEIVLRRVREEVVELDGDVSSEETRMRQRAIAKEFGVCVSSCGHVSGHLGGLMDDDDDQEDPDTRLRGRILEMAFEHLSPLINDEGRPEELRWEVLDCVPAALSLSVHNGEWHRDHQNASLARGAVGQMMDLAADACDATVAREEPGAPEMTPLSLIALRALRKLEPAVVFHIVGPLVAQQLSSEDPSTVKAIHIEMAAAYRTRADDFDSNDQAACREISSKIRRVAFARDRAGVSTRAKALIHLTSSIAMLPNYMQQAESRNLLAACVKEAEALAMDRAVLLTCIKDVIMRLGPRPSPINSPSEELDGGKELRQSLQGVVSECMRHLGKHKPVGDKALKTQHAAVDIMTKIVEKWPAALGRDGVTGQLIDYLLNVALSVGIDVSKWLCGTRQLSESAILCSRVIITNADASGQELSRQIVESAVKFLPTFKLDREAENNKPPQQPLPQAPEPVSFTLVTPFIAQHVRELKAGLHFFSPASASSTKLMDATIDTLKHWPAVEEQRLVVATPIEIWRLLRAMVDELVGGGKKVPNSHALKRLHQVVAVLVPHLSRDGRCQLGYGAQQTHILLHLWDVLWRVFLRKCDLAWIADFTLTKDLCTALKQHNIDGPVYRSWRYLVRGIHRRGRELALQQRQAEQDDGHDSSGQASSGHPSGGACPPAAAAAAFAAAGLPGAAAAVAELHAAAAAGGGGGPSQLTPPLEQPAVVAFLRESGQAICQCWTSCVEHAKLALEIGEEHVEDVSELRQAAGDKVAQTAMAYEEFMQMFGSMRVGGPEGEEGDDSEEATTLSDELRAGLQESSFSLFDAASECAVHHPLKAASLHAMALALKAGGTHTADAIFAPDGPGESLLLSIKLALTPLSELTDDDGEDGGQGDGEANGEEAEHDAAEGEEDEDGDGDEQMDVDKGRKRDRDLDQGEEEGDEGPQAKRQRVCGGFFFDDSFPDDLGLPQMFEEGEGEEPTDPTDVHQQPETDLQAPLAAAHALGALADVAPVQLRDAQLNYPDTFDEHYVNTILDKLDNWVEILRDGNKHQGDDVNELVYTVLTTQFVLTEQFWQDKAVFADVGKVQERFSFWLTYIMPTLLDRLDFVPLPDDLHHMDIDTPPHTHARHHRPHHNAMRPSEMRARCEYAARQAHEVWLRLLGDYLADSTISEDEPEEPVGFFNLYKYANKMQLLGYLGSLIERFLVLVVEEDGRRAAVKRLKAIQEQVHLHPGEAPSTPT